MKSPMNMAPNKMVSPAKALSDLKPNLGTGKNEIDPNSKFGKKVAAAGPPMKEPMKMKSPMKMGSAYKMDKSAFKLKSAPVNMRTPGSVAKMAGVSPVKNKYVKAIVAASKGSNFTTAVQRAKLSLKDSNKKEAEANANSTKK